MRIQTTSKKIGTLLVTVSAAFTALFVLLRHPIMNLLASYLSPDHSISAYGERQVSLTYFFWMVMLLAAGIGLIKAQDRSWRTRLLQVVLGKSTAVKATFWPSPRTTLILSTVVGGFLIINMKIWNNVPQVFQFFYAKDHGFLDLLVPITMFVSFILFAITIWRLGRRNPRTHSSKVLLAFYLLLAIMLFLYVGEEINWGQTFFNWATPELFSGNVEHETNLHNYFNSYFDYGYISLSLVLGVVLFSLWASWNKRWQPVSQLLLPHSSLIGLSVLIAYISIVFYTEQELLEEMVAVFVFFYAVRIYQLIRVDRKILS